MAQVNNDFDPEGISIPSQRKACILKAQSLGAEIVAEYVEPGRSARSVEGRPIFQEMMMRLRADKDIDFVIVYQFSRLFRNSLDAAMTKVTLRKIGTRVVPTIADMGEGAEATPVVPTSSTR
jgi:DNA invertase Pin-like site-specific DNA recombinase